MKMLRRMAATAVLLCALATLSGCQPPTSLYLMNNSGHTVIVIESTGRWRNEGIVYTKTWGRYLPWPYMIADGSGRRVDHAWGWEWIVDARVGRSRVRYEIPVGRDLYDGEAWWGFDFWRHDVTMQLESDGRVYLVAVRVPRNGRPAAVDLAPFRDIQPDGFPINPSSRECR